MPSIKVQSSIPCLHASPIFFISPWYATGIALSCEFFRYLIIEHPDFNKERRKRNEFIETMPDSTCILKGHWIQILKIKLQNKTHNYNHFDKK